MRELAPAELPHEGAGRTAQAVGLCAVRACGADRWLQFEASLRECAGDRVPRLSAAHLAPVQMGREA